jgi:hypothetical protein
MENDLTIRAENIHIGDGEKVFMDIQLILNALVPAHVYIATHQMGGGLYGSRYGDLGHNICEYFAFIVVFNGHISSVGQSSCKSSREIKKATQESVPPFTSDSVF